MRGREPERRPSISSIDDLHADRVVRPCDGHTFRLLMLSCSLKGLHIRRLYDLALEIMKNNAKYSSFKPRLGVRLFLFGDIVDHASGSSLAER